MIPWDEETAAGLGCTPGAARIRVREISEDAEFDCLPLAQR